MKLLLFLLFSIEIYANGLGIVFDRPILNGTGCPKGSSAIVMSPDGQTVSLLFDQFVAEVPQFDGNNDNDESSEENEQNSSRLDQDKVHKVCHIHFKATIPEGFKVQQAIVDYDLRGSTFLERKVNAAIRSIFINHKGPNGENENKNQLLVRKVWRGDTQEDWILNTSAKIKLNSGCSTRGKRNIHFQLKNILVVKSRNDFQGFISLDSQDLVSSLKFKTKIKKCQNGPNGHGHNDNTGRRHHR